MGADRLARARAQLRDQRVGPLRVLQQHGHEVLRAFQLLLRLERHPAQVHQAAAHGGGPEVAAQRHAETPPLVNFDLRRKPPAEERRVGGDGRRALLGARVRFGGAVHVKSSLGIRSVLSRMSRSEDTETRQRKMAVSLLIFSGQQVRGVRGHAEHPAPPRVVHDAVLRHVHEPVREARLDLREVPPALGARFREQTPLPGVGVDRLRAVLRPPRRVRLPEPPCLRRLGGAARRAENRRDGRGGRTANLNGPRTPDSAGTRMTLVLLAP